MLKNKIIVKKIRNIFILLMAIMIMIGAYKNIRDSRAENVIQVEVEVADKSNILENQIITVNATETKDGNYLLDLPTSVNENIVTKYYATNGSEVAMDDKKSDRTLRLTDIEVANKKVELETDYDKKDVTTKDNQVVTLYNKELKQKQSENTIAEDEVTVTGYMPLDVKTEIKEIDLATLTQVKLLNEEQTMRKAYEVSVYQEKNTENEKVEYDPSIYDERIEIKTKNPDEYAKPYIYNLEEDDQAEYVAASGTDEANQNIIAVEEKSDKTVRYLLATEQKVEDIATYSNDDIALTASYNTYNTLKETYKETSYTSGFLGNTNIQRCDIENVTFLNSTSGANSTQWDVSAAGNNSIIAWYETTSNGAYKVYIGSNETIYANSNSNYLFAYIGYSYDYTSTELITNIDLLNLKYVVDMGCFFQNAGGSATQLNLGSNFDTSNVTNMYAMFKNFGHTPGTGVTNLQKLYLGDKFDTSNVTIMQYMFDGAYIGQTLDLGEKFVKIYDNCYIGFMRSANTKIYVPSDIYVNSTTLKAVQSGTTSTYVNLSINASTYYSRELILKSQSTTGGTLKSTSSETSQSNGFLGNTSIQRQYIDNVTFVNSTSGANSTKWDVSEAGDGSILAWYETNSNGTYKVYIGSNGTIYANANSSYLFTYIGYSSLCTSEETITNINLLNTSKVTSMSYMFFYTGYSKMSKLDLGDNFDTSNVTSMNFMFFYAGYTSMINMQLGNKFDTSKVQHMSRIFMATGNTKMETLNLGSAFTKFPTDSNSRVDVFRNTGKSGCVIYVPSSIYQDSNNAKVNSSSSTTVEYTRGTFQRIGGGGKSYLKATSTETSNTSGFLGNTSIQRQNIENVTFLNSTSGANSTKWDVSAAGNGSIVAWYETSNSNGALKVYIGSDGDIYANSDSSYLFSYIGYNSICTDTTVISNIRFLNTNEVTNMKDMFQRTGWTSMTKLDLGDNFDTSNVTNMQAMFMYCGNKSLQTLNLGSNFNTINVTDMYNMFVGAGEYSLTSLDLGEKFDTRNVTRMMQMFFYMRSLKTLKIGNNFDTSSVTNMHAMFSTCSALTSLDLGDKFNTSNVTDMGNMFFGTRSITELRLGKAFKNIASTNSNFVENCGVSGAVIWAAKEIYQDHTHFKLNSSSSTTIEYTRGTINPITDKHYLKSTSKETESTSGFLGNTSIQRQNIENVTFVNSVAGANSTRWDVSADGDSSILAWYITSNSNGALKVYIGSDGDIYANSDSSYLFSWIGNNSICTDTTVISNIRLLNTNEVTNMQEMFYFTGTSNMTKLDLGDNFDTSSVTNMQSMFYDTGVRTLKNLDLGEKFDTSNVTNMQFMFSDMYVLTTLDLGEKFDTRKVTNMSCMFSVLPALKTLSLGDKFDTSNVTDMSGMFRSCSSLNTLDLGPKFTQIASDNSDMFNYTGTTGATIYVPEEIFKDKTHVKLNSTSSTTIEYTRGEFVPKNTLKVTNTETEATSGFLGNTNIQRQNIENITFVNSTAGANSTKWDVSVTEDASVLAWYTTTSSGALKVYIGTNKSTIYANPNSSSLFGYIGYASNCTATEVITNIALLNTSNATTMASMFIKTGYNAMTTLNLGNNFNTSKVANMEGMFFETGYTAMKNLDLGDKFDTSNVTNMRLMFGGTGYTKMTTIDLGKKFDTSNVTNMTSMFSSTGFASLTSLNLGNKFDTSNVTIMNNMFSQTGYRAMTELRLGKAFKNIASTNSNFVENCGASGAVIWAPKEIFQDHTHFKLNSSSTTTIEYARGTINPLIEKNYLRSTSTESTGYSAFLGNTSIERQNIENVTFVNSVAGANSTRWDVSADGDSSILAWYETSNSNGALKVYIGSDGDIYANEDSSYLFSYIGNSNICTATETITNIELLNTEDVTNMKCLFSNMGRTMTTLDLGNNFDTSNVTNMEGMFYWTGIGKTFTSLKLGNKFDTSNVTDMKRMFMSTGTGGITTLDLGEKFDTSNVTDMQFMFSDMYALKTLNLGDKFDTSNVTNMQRMFYANTALTELKLGNKFDTSNVTNMQRMFYGCRALTTLNLGYKFDTRKVTDMSSMFNGTTSLTTLDLGAAFTNIASTNTDMFTNAGVSGSVKIYAPSAIFKDSSNFRLNSSSSETLSYTRGTIVLKYKPTWKLISSIPDDTNQKIVITAGLMGYDIIANKPYPSTTSVEVTRQDIQILPYDTFGIPYTGLLKDVTSENYTETVDGYTAIGTKCTFSMTTIDMGAHKIEENNNVIYKAGTGNFDIRFIQINNKFVDNFGNINVTSEWIRGEKTNKNTNGKLFVDYKKPSVIYQNQKLQIDATGKTAKLIFDVTDKYYDTTTSKTLGINDITVKIGDKVIDSTTNIRKTLTSTELTATVDSSTKVVGRRYTLTLENLEELQIKEGEKYLDYSGIINVIVPGGIAKDYSGNTSVSTTITTGIDLPEETGSAEVVDVIVPKIEKIDSSVDLDAKTASVTLRATDKYFARSTLTSSINVYVNGSVSTSVGKSITTKNLTETRTENGTTSTVQYGQEVTVKLTNLPIDVNQVKISIPEGAVLDTSGNRSKAMSIMFINKLRATSKETLPTSKFLENANIQRQDIENVTFVDDTSSKNDTAWDVSAMQDKSILAWYTTNANGSLKVYIGSDCEIFANTDSSYLFAYIGYGTKCTATNTITNIAILNTSLTTDMTAMFMGTGSNSMTKLDLGTNFDTQNVTSMRNMFAYTGYNAITTINFGDKFNTSNVTDMSLMFANFGYTALTTLNLGENFSTANVVNMSGMFEYFGYTKLENLDLGNKFYTTNVTDMSLMFKGTGTTAMTNLDLGPAFTNIVADSEDIFTETGKSGSIVVQVAEAIFQNRNNFKLSSGTINFTRGKINPQYRIEWIKESITVNELSSSIDITLRGTTNTQVDANEYISNVTGKLLVGDIKILIDGTDISNKVTKVLGNATQVANTRTGAKDVTYKLTLSDFAKNAEKITGKSYLEWSGNITVDVAQGTAVDDYGNKNIELTNAGERANNTIKDAKQVEQNTANTMFADFIKPQFTYVYSSGDIDKTNKTLTMEFSVTDKYYNATLLTPAEIANAMTVKILDTNTEIDNAKITKSVEKVEDLTETRDGVNVKVGEKYRLVISGLEQKTIEGKYKDYSGPMSITIPKNLASDKSGNKNIDTVITIGVNAPDNTGNQEIVDVINPTWKMENLKIDNNNQVVTLDLIGTDKYFKSSSLTASQIVVTVEGKEVTALKKEFTNTEELKETRNGSTEQYGIKYTLKLSNWKEADKKDKKYFEYSGNTTIKIPKGAIVDKSDNSSEETTFDLGMVDALKPEITKVSSTIDATAKTETIIFDITDKYINADTIGISKEDTSKIHVYVDKEEATGVTKTLKSIEDLKDTVDGTSAIVGKRYTVEISGFKQNTLKTDRSFVDYSGTVSLGIEAGVATDTSNNANTETTIDGDFVDFIEPNIIYKYVESDIDYNKKEVKVEFDVTDKYLTTGKITINDLNIKIDGETPDWSRVTRTLREEDVINKGTINKTIDGKVQTGLTNQSVGKHYTLTLTGLEEIERRENQKYVDYSGVVSVVIEKGKFKDTSNNNSVATTITMGVDLPENTGSEVIADVVDPLWEATDITVNPQQQTATVVVEGTDKYFDTCTLAQNQIKILEDGVESTTATVTNFKKVKDLTESRNVNGTTSTVQYGVQYTISISGYKLDKNQVKIQIPAKTLKDKSGNTNKDTGIMIYNMLRETSEEYAPDSPFLGNEQVKREKVENVTFINSIADANETQWDVSAAGDDSILAWYKTTSTGSLQVYIGSKYQMFANRDSSYLFGNLGFDEECKATEIITNLELLDTHNVANMSYMFTNIGRNAITTLRLGNNFDTSSVTNMSWMFRNTGELIMETLDLGEKFDTSNVTNMQGMFYYTGYRKLKELNLGEKFITSNVTDMSSMFIGAGHDSMQILDLGENFDTSKVTTMDSMFWDTGYSAMTELNLRDKFDTSSVTNMNMLFNNTGNKSMTSLDLGNKFTTVSATNMTDMFRECGTESMISLDLGPAFTKIADVHNDMLSSCGKSGELTIYAPEAIFSDQTHFKLSKDSSTTIEITDKIEPKYRTQWVKDSTTINEANKSISITLRGTTNTEVDAKRYFSDVTGSLTTSDIKVFIDGTDITNIVTKSLGTATQATSKRTGAKDVLQVLTLSNFEEAARKTGKNYIEWSGNIYLEVAQSTLTDTTGPADANGKKITYGNKNVGVSAQGTRISETVKDTITANQNGSNAMFTDFIKPEFTYVYSDGNIDITNKTLTVDFSAVDKYFDKTLYTTQEIANKITVKLLDTNTQIDNAKITKTVEKIEDVTETRSGSDTPIKIGEKYRLVISGLEETDIADGAKYKDYSGPMSITIPENMAADKSGNKNLGKTITIGVNEPGGSSSNQKVVDVVDPTWKVENISLNSTSQKATIDLIGTDKYYKSSSLTADNIDVFLEGDDITATTITKSLSRPTSLTEIRNGSSVQYGVKYTLTLSDLEESYTEYLNSGRPYKEYSGNMNLKISEGVLKDSSGNSNKETTLNLGLIDVIKPMVEVVSSSKDIENKTAELVVNITDKYFKQNLLTPDSLQVMLDGTNITSGITKEVEATELKTMINGTLKQYGVQYKIKISGYPINGRVLKIRVPEGSVVDETGNTNEYKDCFVYSTLKSAASEKLNTSKFLGSTMQRQNIESVTFVDNIPSTVYDYTTDRYVDVTAWDVSVNQDKSIMAWHTSNSSGAYKVYIGSNCAMFANSNSSYLFADIGYSTKCKATEVINNLDVLYIHNITDANHMFFATGYRSMTKLDLGNNFDTSNITDMERMFGTTGYLKMTTLKLGPKFDTSKVTEMTAMFWRAGNDNMTTLDLGPAFTKIASSNSTMFNYCGKDWSAVIYAPESIYNSSTQFKLSTTSSTTISYTRGTINPKYKPEWGKVSVKLDKENKKMTVRVSGKVDAEKYAGAKLNIAASLDATDAKMQVYIDGELADGITKNVVLVSKTDNEVIYDIELSDLEQNKLINEKSYKEWSGNIAINFAKGTLNDAYGNKNMEIINGVKQYIQGEKVNQNTENEMFMDLIAPSVIYMNTNLEKDEVHKSVSMIFDVTDKYYSSENKDLQLSDFTIKIDDKIIDNSSNIIRNLRVVNLYDTIDGNQKIVGKRYWLTLSGLEQLQIKEGDKYLDYSGVITIAIPEGKAKDDSSNTNVATTITTGIDLPEGTGTAEVVDVVAPHIEATSLTVDAKAKTGTVTIQATDKYFASSTLSTGIQVYVNGAKSTSVGMTIAAKKNLNETRIENGESSTVQYGEEVTVNLTDIPSDSTIKQVKLLIPEGTVLDKYGNKNKETSIILINKLIATNTETYATAGFLGNTNIARERIETVTFVDNLDNVNSTAKDVSAQGDGSILSWYDEKTSMGGYQQYDVYIGSDYEIFANSNSSYLFAWLGTNDRIDYTKKETIVNIDLLNTVTATDMDSMFYKTGTMAMEKLDLGSKFDTSNVTNMENMFNSTGYNAMKEFDLGDKFDTSKVTDMSYMFYSTGSYGMTSLDLGSKFNTSEVRSMNMMFSGTGNMDMTSLNLGNNFDTSKVTNMNAMFQNTGNKMTSLDLGDKFYTSKVTDMNNMFNGTGRGSMTSLDLGPAFTTIASTNTNMFQDTGKSGSLVVYAPESIYSNKTNFKLNTNSSTTVALSTGTINAKYRIEWQKEAATVNTTNKSISITLRATTNPEVDSSEYTSDVTGSLAVGNIKVLIDGTDITNIVTKSLGTATQVDNTRTGAKDVTYTLTLSKLEEASRRTGKNYLEWSGNITIQVSQGTATDKYGNKNIAIASDGERADNTVNDEKQVEQNTENAMFADFIKPEFTYVYSSGNIDIENKTLTVEFSIVDKYFDKTLYTSQELENKITVKLLDSDTQIDNAKITKSVEKIEDVTETRDGASAKIGEKYKLVIGGLQQSDIANGEKYKDYSGPMSITIPANLAQDKSENKNIDKIITIGVNEPDHTGNEQIVDVVDPIWKTENLNIDYTNKIVTVDLVGTDKYFKSSNLTTADITVYVDGTKVTTTENVIKELSEPEKLTETRTYNGVSNKVQYGVRYTLTLSKWEESDKPDGRSFLEWSGNTKIELAEGKIQDQYGNTSKKQEFELGLVDFINPKIVRESVTTDKTAQTETIIFNVSDKYLDTVKELSENDIKVYVDKEEATGITKVLTKLSDITATVNGSLQVVGQQYKLVLSNFKQERTQIDTARNFTDWSGTVSIKIAKNAVKDTSNNTLHEDTEVGGAFVDYIKPEITYKYAEGDIDYKSKTFTMQIEAIDKYFAESSILTTENLKKYLTIKVDNEDITNNDKVTKEIIATENVYAGTEAKPINKTIDGVVQTGLINQVIGKRYTLKLSNLEQTIKTEDFLNYSGVVTVTFNENPSIVKDTSNNSNVSTTITSGLDFPGESTGDGKIVDVVDPLWEQVGSATATPRKQTASIILRGTDKYLNKSKSELTTDKIKVIVNGVEQTSGITVKVTEDTSVTMTYGKQYKVEVSGFVSNAYQVKIVLAEGTLVDNSGNKSKEQEFVLYSCLRKTDTEKTATSSFLGNSKVQRQKVEKVIFEDYANYNDNTKWDVSAQEDGSIIAWYETTSRGTYIVHIGSSIIMNGNVDSSYLFANIGRDTACAETSEASNPIIENIGLLHVDNVTNMSHMFEDFGYSKMKTFSLGDGFDTSSVTDMSNMFNEAGYTAMTTITFGSKFTTKNVTNMSRMLRSLGYTAMGELTLPDSFDTSKVTNMMGMFVNVGHEKMKTFSLSNNFDTSKVTDMSYMFANTGYTAMTSLDLKDKFFTTKVENMTNMFSGTGAKAMTVLDLGEGFTKIASQNTSMFANCGTSSLVIYAPELIYSSGTSFKLGK